jgi:hypothetical protein
MSDGMTRILLCKKMKKSTGSIQLLQIDDKDLKAMMN